MTSPQLRTQKVNLRVYLDMIWRAKPETRKDVAKAISAELTADEWCSVLAWDIAAVCFATPGRIDVRPGFNIQVVSEDVIRNFLMSEGLPGAIEEAEYTYCPYRIYSVDRLSVARTRHDGSALLECMQYIRDHFDTLLFHSNEIRTAEVRALAEEFGITENHFMRLAQWFSALVSGVPEQFA